MPDTGDELSQETTRYALRAMGDSVLRPLGRRGAAALAEFAAMLRDGLYEAITADEAVAAGLAADGRAHVLFRTVAHDPNGQVVSDALDAQGVPWSLRLRDGLADFAVDPSSADGALAAVERLLGSGMYGMDESRFPTLGALRSLASGEAALDDLDWSADEMSSAAATGVVEMPGADAGVTTTQATGRRGKARGARTRVSAVNDPDDPDTTATRVRMDTPQAADAVADELRRQGIPATSRRTRDGGAEVVFSQGGRRIPEIASSFVRNRDREAQAEFDADLRGAAVAAGRAPVMSAANAAEAVARTMGRQR